VTGTRYAVVDSFESATISKFAQAYTEGRGFLNWNHIPVEEDDSSRVIFNNNRLFVADIDYRNVSVFALERMPIGSHW
jgi:hypothetical protein